MYHIIRPLCPDLVLVNYLCELKPKLHKHLLLNSAQLRDRFIHT